MGLDGGSTRLELAEGALLDGASVLLVDDVLDRTTEAP